jgi:hypothetical protein
LDLDVKNINKPILVNIIDMKVSVWRKLKLYLQYRKNVVSNKSLLENAGLRIDRVKRIYTVVNVPETLFDEVYGMKTADINRVSQSYITEKVREISKMLNGIQLAELYKLYETKKVDRYSYLLVIGFSLLDTKKMADNFWYRILPTTLILSLIAFLSLYF